MDSFILIHTSLIFLASAVDSEIFDCIWEIFVKQFEYDSASFLALFFFVVVSYLEVKVALHMLRVKLRQLIKDFLMLLFFDL